MKSNYDCYPSPWDSVEELLIPVLIEAQLDKYIGDIVLKRQNANLMETNMIVERIATCIECMVISYWKAIEKSIYLVISLCFFFAFRHRFDLILSGKKFHFNIKNCILINLFKRWLI